MGIVGSAAGARCGRETGVLLPWPGPATPGRGVTWGPSHLGRHDTVVGMTPVGIPRVGTVFSRHDK